MHVEITIIQTKTTKIEAIIKRSQIDFFFKMLISNQKIFRKIKETGLKRLVEDLKKKEIQFHTYGKNYVRPLIANFSYLQNVRLAFFP